MDGHSGIKNERVNEGGSERFRLVLSALQESSGETYFVIHATSNISYSPGIQPRDFLQGISLEHFRGSCPFHNNECFWKIVATLDKKNTYGFEDIHNRLDKIQSIHDSFNRFSEEIDKLYGLVNEQKKIVESVRLECVFPSIFGSPPVIKLDSRDIPDFVEEVKFSKLRDLEEQQNTINKEIKDLREYLPLLYGNEATLKPAVKKALEYFSLGVEFTKPGFTIDLLAQTKDGSMKFGFEVTGIESKIGKDSNKLTQVLEFERIKEHNEKTVLLANTYKNTPIPERLKNESFTKPVIDFLSSHPILLMTGWDLYQMVRDVMEQGKNPDDITKLLYEKRGVLLYP